MTIEPTDLQAQVNGLRLDIAVLRASLQSLRAPDGWRLDRGYNRSNASKTLMVLVCHSDHDTWGWGVPELKRWSSGMPEAQAVREAEDFLSKNP